MIREYLNHLLMPQSFANLQGRYTCATTGAFVTVVDFRQLHEEAVLESSLLLETIKVSELH